MTILSLLREDAKRWWYHAELRRQGRISEARNLEHRSIRNHVSDIRTALRTGGFITLGRGGWTLHIDACTTMSHYDCDSPFVKAVRRAGIHGWDSRTISDRKIYETIGLPMAIVETQAEPTATNAKYPRSMQLLHFSAVAPMYAALGAEIF